MRSPGSHGSTQREAGHADVQGIAPAAPGPDWGRERKGRAVPGGLGRIRSHGQVCRGGSLRPAFSFTADETPSHRPHSLITLGDPFPPLLEALLAERLKGGAESSDPVPSPRPKAFALTALCPESPHRQSARLCAHAHVHTHTRTAEFSPRLSSELALSAAHHLRGKVAPC